MLKIVARYAVLLTLLSGVAYADNFSFTGTFSQDDNVQLFNFIVGAPSAVTLRTWSYAGGTNAAGTVIARGGFDPILALFNSGGSLINQNDDGGCGLVAADAVSANCWDTFLTASLTAGTYTVAVMEYDNFANGPNLSNGFTRTGQGNFTGPLTGHPGESFWDVANTHRDNHWAFDILNVQGATQTPVPEPASMLTLLPALLVLGGGLIRSRRT
jgi:hypothetical protein